jgi:hypothetical protein
MTIMILTNEVIINNKDGSRVNTVIKASNCRVRLYLVPPLPSSIILTIGSPLCANTEVEASKPTKKTMKVSLGSFALTTK